MITVYGAGDVARLKKVTDAAVSMWLARYEDTPEPAVELRSGKSVTWGWDDAGMAAWAAWTPPSRRNKAPETMPVIEVTFPEEVSG